MGLAWSDFHGDSRDQTLPYMFQLVAIGLVIPLNTACVQRGFSLHAGIKTKLHSRLKVPQVDAMLRIMQLCAS